MSAPDMTVPTTVEGILDWVRTEDWTVEEASARLRELFEDQKLRNDAALAVLPKMLELCLDQQNNWELTTVCKRAFELADEFVAQSKVLP